MSLFPDFSNEETFPSFSGCPLKESLPTSTTRPTRFLLGTIQDNMTLAMHPSFICKDRNQAPFALTLKLPKHMQKEGSRGGLLDFKLYRKGWTILVRGPERKGVEEGKKQGFVECELGDSLVIPATLDKLAEMHNKEWTKEIVEDGKVACQGCEEVKGKDDLSRCKGCAVVWYCNKECQTKGWSEKDHKTECKVFKALKNPFLDPIRIHLIAQ